MTAARAGRWTVVPGGTARWALPVLAGTAMLAVAQGLAVPRLLFPEGVALAFGVWVARRPGWIGSRWRLVLVPTVCALIGLLIERLPGPRWALAVLALGGALAVLWLLRSDLGPAVSAAVLPVWFGIGEWAYLVLVAAFCGVLALLAPSPVRGDPPPGPVTGRVPLRVQGVFAPCAALWLTLVGSAGLPPAAAAPPLLVACLEFVAVGAPPLIWEGVRRWALLSAAAVLGAVAAACVPWPWLAGTLALSGVALLMSIGRAPVGPALAIALVPFVLGHPDPVETVLAVSAGAAVLHILPALQRSIAERTAWRCPSRVDGDEGGRAAS